MFYRGSRYHGMRYPTASIFEQHYRCYPMSSFMNKAPHLENGDKVILPLSALDRLASLRIEYPMKFELHNTATSRTSHCGVLEFDAEEGVIYMPSWMMENMLLAEGDMVRVKSASLPKGTYVKLQPHTKDFLAISNPKAMLETTLRSFSCLTVGDHIMVAYNDKKYYIDILDAKPASAVSIIETDCEVDFAPPLDYKEPEPEAMQCDATTSQAAHDLEAPEAARSNAFMGVGRRLDGKPLTYSAAHAENTAAAVSSRMAQPSKQKTSEAATAAPTSGSGRRQPNRPPGKLIFGGGSTSTNSSTNYKQPENVVEEEPSIKEEPAKFQAFSGKKYSLRG